MFISNLALNFGTLAETVELFLAIAMMIGGIYITHLIQKWADKSGEQQPRAANVGRGGTVQHEDPGLRR